MKRYSKRVLLGFGLAAFVVFFAFLSFPHAATAATGINQQVSFQGKLVNSNGTNVPDGTYNLQFKIYQDGTGCVSSGTAPCGGTLKWTENRLISNNKGVVVTAGTFQVNLGEVNAFGTNVDWNQDSLWLSMNVGGTTNTASPTYDGEMTPFIRLTAVPYALNAGMIGGLTADKLVQLNPGSQQTGAINVSGNITSGGTLQVSTLDTVASGILTVGSTNTSGITLNKNVTITNGQTFTVGGQQVISGTGILQSAAFSGTYSNAVTLSSASNSIAGTFTGSFTGSTIAAQYGGTGNASYAIGDLLYASGTTTLAKLSAGANGTCLKSTGAGSNLTYGTCYSPTMQAAYDGGNTITQTAAGAITFTSGTNVPTADQFTIDNTNSSGVTTAGVSGAQIKYKGGAAAIEASGMRIDFIPGTTSGGTWNGMRIVADATGAASGVAVNGLKLEGPTTPGNGTETGVYIGSGWDVGLNIASGGIQLASSASDPPTPAAGQLRIYAKTIGGRVLPKWTGPSGVDTPVQANFGFNRIAMASPAGVTNTTPNTAFTHFGASGAVGGTGTNTMTTTTLNSTNLLTSVRRTTFKTPATASAYGYLSGGTTSVWRGNANGLGGFYYTTRFGFSGGLLVSGSTAFIGLASAVPSAAANPSTSNASSKLGLYFTSSGNLVWINNVAGTTPATTDLGSSFALDTSSLYELIIFSPPNGSSITYRVRNLSTGATPVENTVLASTNNIVANSGTAAFMTPLIWVNNSTAATASGFDSLGWYLESDN